MFKPGQSGNPKGRPPGLKPKPAQYRAMLLSNADALIQQVIDKALDGDSVALRICADRLIPALKPETPAISLDLPPGSDLTTIGQSIIDAMAGGELSADTAARMLDCLQAQAKLVESEELEARIAALEGLVNRK